MKRILTVTPNPCIDKTLFIDTLTPGTKIRAPRCGCITGGKGCNVSRAVKAMGGDTAAMMLVGGPTGRHAVEMLETQDKVACLPIWVSGLTRTITTVLEEPIHRQTALFEPGPSVSAGEHRLFLDKFREAVPDAGMVTLNGSAPDPILDTLYRDLILIAHEHGVPVILDAYGAIFSLALDAKPFMVKPNVEELESLLGRSLGSRKEQWRAVDELLGRDVSLVVLSLGAEGALVASSSERFHAVPPQIDEINAVGSGDALVAGFALGLTRGMGLEDTARLGIAMGTANAMSWDIGTFSREEVLALLSRVQLVKDTR